MADDKKPVKLKLNSCCGTPEGQHHATDCPMIAGIDARFARDFSGATFRDSYIEHSASAVRRRILAATGAHLLTSLSQYERDYGARFTSNGYHPTDNNE